MLATLAAGLSGGDTALILLIFALLCFGAAVFFVFTKQWVAAGVAVVVGVILLLLVGD